LHRNNKWPVSASAASQSFHTNCEADAVPLAGHAASARGLILDTGKGLFAAQYGENIENTRRHGTPRQRGTQWLSKVAELDA
jgi:hypothetical protein